MTKHFPYALVDRVLEECNQDPTKPSELCQLIADFMDCAVLLENAQNEIKRLENDQDFR